MPETITGKSVTHATAEDAEEYEKMAEVITFQRRKLFAIREALGRGETDYAMELVRAALAERS